jgi:hypothetical protein
MGCQVPVKVFCSYSHKDQRLRDELETHLAIMKNNQEIESWHDRKITAGQEWAEQIDENLRTADLILLLVSANFLASRYCWDVEMKLAMERHERGEAVVIPILLKPVEWEDAPFGKLQACPTNARPITEWSNRDKAFVDVVQAIRKAVRQLPERGPTKASAPAQQPLIQPKKPANRTGVVPAARAMTTLDISERPDRKNSADSSETEELQQRIDELSKLLIQTKRQRIRERIVILSSHKDQDWLQQLKEFLAPAVRAELISEWEDTQIQPGAQWRDEIQTALSTAKVAVLMVSAGFLNSEFITSEELPTLLQEAKDEGLVICPVIVDHCLYDFSALKDYQAANDVSKPLMALKVAERNNVLLEISRKILSAMQV